MEKEYQEKVEKVIALGRLLKLQNTNNEVLGELFSTLLESSTVYSLEFLKRPVLSFCDVEPYDKNGEFILKAKPVACNNGELPVNEEITSLTNFLINTKKEE